MNEDVMPDFLGDIVNKMGNFTEPASAPVTAVDSLDYDIVKMVEDRVCGLLLKDSLTVEEIALLAALLQIG